MNCQLECQTSNINCQFFVSAFENDRLRTSHSSYYLPNVELKDCNKMINGENVFDEPITYENIRKIATGRRDDCTTACLLDYPYFKDSSKMIAVDLSEQQASDENPRKNQQINFTANLVRGDDDTNKRIYFILEEAKETILDFSQGTVKVL